MHYLFSLSAVLLCLIGATQANPAPTMPPIPPPYLYCCPEHGPKGLELVTEQHGPYDIFCYYDQTTQEACFYDPGSGLGGGPATGCHKKAPKNKKFPTPCPGPEKE